MVKYWTLDTKVRKHRVKYGNLPIRITMDGKHMREFGESQVELGSVITSDFMGIRIYPCIKGFRLYRKQKKCPYCGCSK